MEALFPINRIRQLREKRPQSYSSVLMEKEERKKSLKIDLIAVGKRKRKENKKGPERGLFVCPA
ncbi:MAG: hypothetical protein ACHQ0Y_02270 [Thermodesulfovibrionales bacterium]